MGVAVEYGAAFTETTDKGVLLTLIEKETWLFRIQKIDTISNAVHLDPTRFKVLAAHGRDTTSLHEHDLLGLAGLL